MSKRNKPRSYLITKAVQGARTPHKEWALEFLPEPQNAQKNERIADMLLEIVSTRGVTISEILEYDSSHPQQHRYLPNDLSFRVPTYNQFRKALSRFPNPDPYVTYLSETEAELLYAQGMRRIRDIAELDNPTATDARAFRLRAQYGSMLIKRHTDKEHEAKKGVPVNFNVQNNFNTFRGIGEPAIRKLLRSIEEAERADATLTIEGEKAE